MVLYFSGTGNSRFAARRIADALGEEALSINERIRSGDTAPIAVGERVVIVVPTYAWRIPRVVREWLRKTELVGAKRAWFVMTCGSEIGDAARYNRALCAEKGVEYMGTAELVMPENYIAMFSAPDTDAAREIVRRAEPVIERAAVCIAEGRRLPAPRDGAVSRLMSGAVNPVFYAVCVKTKPFSVGEACVGCGQCARLCPLHNIALRDGKPVWGKDCTHCMACICYCPVEAIEYGKKSLGQPRYHIEAL